MKIDKNFEISDILRYSIRWFNNKNPYKTQIEHLENPEVNCITEAEKNLAVSIANYIRK